MNKAKVIKEIQKILDISKVGVLSTSHNNVPNSRYMVFYHDEAVLYTKTDEDSPKVEEVESNPQAHILLGYEETKNKSFLEIRAKVEVINNQETIDWLWETQDKAYFDSKNDPDLTVLKLIPEQIKIMNSDNFDTPEIINMEDI
ncbi:general stress protein [Oceanobacillus oncorhynchi subsp. incaldanensis]|uniref:pyridoxamine 5'-phosphate oxidase family protein n=1 Tax=Oceanobacillus TaxID=182709 RepID=UPI0018664375|nr:pyridoxamine 5'-phosphate oxidase family protein [Oceanobacillus oncorhynchi]GIO20240.1 general stress protein [Oceanobacillus oncorhynchi subsp. incaldanensis]